MNYFKILLFLLLLLIFPLTALCQEKIPADHVSPKKPWKDFKVVEKEESTLAGEILLWLPNRVLDLLDIVKFDVGIGPAVGGVVRVTKYANAGYRMMAPASVRIGYLGRRSPVMLEKSSEFGVSPAYSGSLQREICYGEVGAGVDLLIASVYLGVCPDEAVDFAAGIFTFDIMDDDLKP